MLKHILMVKLKDNSDAEREKLAAHFLTMQGRVPSIIKVQAGADYLRSPRSYDVCLIVTLENRAALDIYQADRYHCDVIKPYVAARKENSIAVDFDC